LIGEGGNQGNQLRFGYQLQESKKHR